MVEDRPGELWITLTDKSAENENIKIEATMFDGSVLEPNSGDDETEDRVRLHISMLVDVWKEGETDLMEFVCSAWSDSLEIQKIYVFRRDNPTKCYMGPDIMYDRCSFFPPFHFHLYFGLTRLSFSPLLYNRFYVDLMCI